MKVLDSPYLFVYGTLKQSYNNECALFLRNNAHFLCSAFCYGTLKQISWYPGLVIGKKHTEKVYGEVFQFSDAHTLFSVLDEYEDLASGEYSREIITVYTETKELSAWVYVYTG